MWTANYVQSEVKRQHSTKFTEFEQALNLAKLTGHVHGPYEFVKFVQAIAAHVEPDINVWRLAGRHPGRAHHDRGNRYVNTRLSEVGFLIHVSQPCPANEVWSRFQRWCQIPFFEMKDFGNVTIQGYFDGDEKLVDDYIKQLLDIHPWADGNGRTASILRNWMLGTLDDPSPLPYYYGEWK